MPTEAVLLKIEDNDELTGTLDRASGELDAPGGELVLDFSSVRRIDSGGLRAMENLVKVAEEKAIKVSIRAVDVGVYKVLKLMKLTQRLSFVN